jgi:tetratricopeptide (TPR) repeat protein
MDWAFGSRWLLFLVLAFGPASISTAARAQSDRQQCADPALRMSLEQRVQACTRALRAARSGRTVRGLLLGARGAAHLNNNEPRRAIADFDEALKLDPKSAPAYALRGVAHNRLGNDEQALADYKSALGLDPRNIETLVNRANYFASKNRTTEALADTTAALQIDPNYGPALYMRAILHMRQDQAQKALADINALFATSSRPGAKEYGARAWIRGANRDPTGALADFDEAIRMDAQQAWLFRDRGQLHLVAGRPAAALEDLSAALRLDPRDAVALKVRARAFVGLKRFEEARQDLAAVLRADPDDRAALLASAELATDTGDFVGALTFIERSIQQRDDAEARNRRAWNRLLLRDLAPAEADIEVALSKERRAEFLDTRGWIRFRKGEFDRALDDFADAMRLDPRIGIAYLGRGRIELDRGALDAALSHLDQAVRLETGAPIAPHAFRGAAYEKKGIAALAVEDYRKALGFEPRQNHPDDREGVEVARAGLGRLLAPAGTAATPGSETMAAVAPPAAADKSQRRIALVIGNSDYANVPALPNAANDAKGLAATLRRIGFDEVIERANLSLDALSVVLKKFGDLASSADWAVIYYAGHGIELNGINYLLPVDAKLQRASHVGDEALPLDRLISKVEAAKKLRLVILDACRNNPFASRMQRDGRTRSVGRGLARIEPIGGTMIAYAARDGTEASDGAGRHSPYAEALMRHLDEPGLDIRFLFDKVRDTVLTKTKNEQMPFTYGSLPAERFVFRTK